MFTCEFSSVDFERDEVSVGNGPRSHKVVLGDLMVFVVREQHLLGFVEIGGRHTGQKERITNELHDLLCTASDLGLKFESIHWAIWDLSFVCSDALRIFH